MQSRLPDAMSAGIIGNRAAARQFVITGAIAACSRWRLSRSRSTRLVARPKSLRRPQHRCRRPQRLWAFPRLRRVVQGPAATDF